MRLLFGLGMSLMLVVPRLSAQQSLTASNLSSVLHPQAEAGDATSRTNAINVEIIKFSKNRPPLKGANGKIITRWDGNPVKGLWEDIFDLEKSKDAQPIARNKRSVTLKNSLPWIGKVVSERFLPQDNDALQMFLIPINKKTGNAVKLVFTKRNTEVTILDGPWSFRVIFRNKIIHLGNDKSIASNWQRLLHFFMRNPKRYDFPSHRLVCGEGSTWFDLYPEYSKADDDYYGEAGWWCMGSCLSYRIEEGLFAVHFMKYRNMP